MAPPTDVLVQPCYADNPVRRRYWSIYRQFNDWAHSPVAVLLELRRQRSQVADRDPGAERVLPSVIDWLCRAQDNSRSHDGGVARDFSLLHGWASSYPETTGYVIPTLVEYAQRSGRGDIAERARRMADWLVLIQLPCGGFQGGKIDSVPVTPVTFNTGQILIGLASAEVHFGGYRDAMRLAADWLVDTQDADGCWRRHPTPFAKPGEKAYEAHVAWGLFEAARVDPGRGYAEAATANVRWMLGWQRSNGWFENCCLDNASRPLTHTIGYALRGVLEAWRFTGNTEFLVAAQRTADGILTALQPHGRLSGRLASDWSSAAAWVCLTGSAQIAHCWLMLSEFTKDQRYAKAGLEANAFVRKTVLLEGPPDVRGGVSGSSPLSGPYGRFAFLNWAAKFLADSLMLEIDLEAHHAYVGEQIDNTTVTQDDSRAF